MMWWGGEGGEMGQSVSVTPGAYHPEIQISENPPKIVHFSCQAGFQVLACLTI